MAAQSTSWNTKNLGSRLAVDVFSAVGAASLVAPLISMIDRGIIENASGRATLKDSIRSSLKMLLLRPHQYIVSKPFRLIVMLYGGTYITANTLDTFFSTVNNKPATTVTAGTPKFFATSTANLSLCLYKDNQFVRMFGPPGAVPGRIPLPSYALFAMRDALTVFASFNVPPLLAPLIPISEGMSKTVSQLSVAQFLAPATIQLASTPLHLLGLDLYNRPAGANGVNAVPWRSRWDAVRVNWLKSSIARICRIVPAFGVGGVVNRRVRLALMERMG